MKKGLALASLILSVVFPLTVACNQAAPAPSTSSAPSQSAAPAQSPAASKAASESSKPAAASTPIKIGYLTPLTGPSGGMGSDLKDGFAMYIDEKGGSLAGRKIELLVEDDEMNPQAGLTKAKKLVEKDGVHMIAGVISSAVAYSVADYVKAQKVLLFLNNAGADDLTKQRFFPYLFRNSFANSQLEFPLGEWAYKKGFRKAATIATDYAAGYETLGGFAKTFTDAGGRIVQEQYPPLGVSDASPFVTAVSSDADVLFAFNTGADALRFVKAYDQYGVKKRLPIIGFSALVDESILPTEGDAAVGLNTSAMWTAGLDTPTNKTFMAAFKTKFKRDATFGAATGYEGAMILDKALQAVNGNIEDKDKFVAAMEKVEVTNSPRGTVKFDKYHNVILNVYVTEVKKVGNEYVNTVIETVKDVSQFWKWSPEEFMKMPLFTDMKGKWAK